MEQLDPKWIRVSSILAMIPSLQDGKWTYPMQQINEDVLQRKADLGTSVHAAISANCKDEFCVLNDKEQKYFDSYIKWEQSVGLLPQETEQRFYLNSMKLTGCVDMIGLINNKRMIIDFKCTVSPDSVKWPLQAALYYILAIEAGLSVEKTCYFVQLDANGELPKVHKYEVTKRLIDTAISWYNCYIYLTNK